MPFCRSSDGTRIHYVSIGEGEPLIMIQGFSWDLTAWHFQLELAYRYKLVLIDNRGVGRSDKPEAPYTMEAFADDVRSVLESEGIASASVLGFSMGGMIAQSLALRYPDLVDSLVLVSTMPRLETSQSIDARYIEGVMKMYDDYGTFLSTQVNIAFSEHWIESNRDVYENFGRLRYELRMPQHAYLNQLMSMQTDLSQKIGSISVPTTVFHGDSDRLVPQSSGRRLFEMIPGSRFLVFRGAGHAIHIERCYEFNRRVIEHMDMFRNGIFRREGPVMV
ncbi:alpha/beta hydrolase fold protein [Thermogymnomonas acidicola]|uniref:Alpha/beta hydrolase fold protein n=1 Tax=Thermogymnomonas acidicola TaxID=399579 RepID=A0AA37F8L4_9ARCH|nr:alpha/beta fold hydrolase [Thermogymnomonas acidicola]GGM66635.1 alpha/beta hydrolase fold protein [Thermogymnomonas acidicola]